MVPFRFPVNRDIKSYSHLKRENEWCQEYQDNKFVAPIHTSLQDEVHCIGCNECENEDQPPQEKFNRHGAATAYPVIKSKKIIDENENPCE